MTRDAEPPAADGLIPVVAAVIERDGTFLLGLRPEGRRHGRMWEFPGGKVGKEESIADAISRELREELGVTVTRVGELLFAARDPGTAFEILFYEVEIAGEPCAVEHDRIRWARRREYLELPLAPADARFAKAGPAEPDGRRGQGAG
ncbi:MAG: NUDIX domain-containing protein [Gemmatimonadota bacterium]|nr:NUDIX domain-containing protein [Gemmatimonadota bacterium]